MIDVWDENYNRYYNNFPKMNMMMGRPPALLQKRGCHASYRP